MDIYTLQSGRDIDLDAMSYLDIDLQDIAHSLGNQCKFNGHTRRFYSYAEHAVILRDLINAESKGQNLNGRIAALLHDAPRCYFGNVQGDREWRARKLIFSSLDLPSDLINEEFITIHNVLSITEGYLLLGSVYWHKAFFEMERQNFVLAERAKDAILSHIDVMWSDPAHAATVFLTTLRAEWEDFCVRNNPESQNAEHTK